MNKLQFKQIISTAVPLNMENVDTDQIIPARFLKGISREGFGENLFHDWRFDSETNKEKDFILNNKNYSGEILVADKNFGCGSSREHAAWALVDYGFRAVISSFFADIFKSNSLNNSLLPIVVSDKFLQHIFKLIDKNSKTKIRIDLEKQTIITEDDKQEFFEINAYKKMCIMNGYDDVKYLESMREKTEEFEATRKNDYSIQY